MGEPGSTLTRHPLNTAFEWVSSQPPYRRLTPQQAEQFDRDGYVVIDDLIDPATLATVISETDRFEAEVDAFLKTQPGERMMIAESGALTFSTHIASRSKVLRALVASSAMTDLCADLIGPDVNLYWDQAVYKKPDKPRRFPWHQDNGYTYIEPQQYLTVWLALTDATLDNGCPVVAPGLHTLGTLEHHYVDPLGFECFDTPPEHAAAPVREGGAVVFSSLMPHLTGPNTTGAVRKAYIVQYAPVGAYTRTKGGDVPCDDPVRQFPVLRNGERV
jgi:ectoine hydroxylase-related dioxygenase (phytanoyl-CoA dioxygenase family)